MLKRVAGFFLTFSLALVLMLQIDFVRQRVVERLVKSLENELGVSIEGDASLSLVPLNVTIENPLFQVDSRLLARGKKATFSLRKFFLKDFILPDFPKLEPITLEGKFSLFSSFSLSGEMTLNHPSLGKNDLSFETDEGLLFLSVEHQGLWGLLRGDGRIQLPRKSGRKEVTRGALNWTWYPDEQAVIRGDGHFIADQREIKLTDFKSRGSLKGQSIELQGNGWVDLEERKFEGLVELSLPKLLEEIEDRGFLIRSPVKLIAEGSGTFESPSFSTHLELEKGETPYGNLEKVSIKSSFYKEDSDWTGETHGSFLLHDLLLNLNGEIALVSGENLILQNFSLTFAEGYGSLEAALDLHDSLFQGSATIATHALPSFFPFEGDLLAHGTLEGSLKQFPFETQGKVSLNSQALKGEGWNVKSFEADLFWLESEEVQNWEGFLSVGEGALFGDPFKKVVFEGTLSGEQMSPFNLRGEREEGPFFLKGETAHSAGSFRFYLRELEAPFLGHHLSLNKTAFVSLHSRGWRVDKVDLKWGENELELFMGMSDTTFSLEGKIRSLNLDDLPKKTFQTPVSGIVSGKASWLDRNGKAFFEVLSLQTPELSNPLFPLDGSLSFDCDSKKLLVETHLLGKGKEKIDLRAEVPLNLENYLFTPDWKSPLLANLNLEGEIAPFLEMILPKTTAALAKGHLELSIGGSLNEPTFFGKLHLKNGVYENLRTGAIYNRIEGELEINQNRLVLNSLRGRDRRGRVVSSSGEMELNSEKRFPFFMDFEADQTEIVNLDYVSGAGTGKIRLSGDLDRGLFSGRLDFDELSITLPKETPLLLQTVDVIYEKKNPIEPSSPWGLDWDLHLSFPQPTTVKGDNFVSGWRGELDIRGTTEALLLFGKANLTSASFTFNGRTFHSNEGVLLFQGEPGAKTTFYITAKQEIENLKIEIILKGPAKSPELTFRSNPPKSSREILSYLLFNRGLGEITSYEGEELSHTIIKLDSVATSSKPNLIDKLKEGLGIDRLEITGEQNHDSEDVSLRVGKYLSPAFYFSLKKSMSDKPNQASLEAQLPHYFKAEAEIGDDGEGKFLLKWERDY